MMRCARSTLTREHIRPSLASHVVLMACALFPILIYSHMRPDFRLNSIEIHVSGFPPPWCTTVNTITNMQQAIYTLKP